MVLKFVIKYVKMSIERIVTAQPTSDISGTFDIHDISWRKMPTWQKIKFLKYIFSDFDIYFPNLDPINVPDISAGGEEEEGNG